MAVHCYILTTAIGFSEECCISQRWIATGPDPNLDLVIALMCMGLYPNVCLHQGKRKVLTTEGKPALIHKTSVNCSNQEQKFPSPLFVFGEKVRTRAISCKQTTMVAPLHLLLFACRKVEWVLTTEGKPALIHKTSVNCSNQEQKFPSPLFVFGEKVRTRAISCKQTTMVAPLHLLLFACRKVEWVDNVVRLDNWLNFNMSPHSAALVVALRPAIEKIVERAAADPDTAMQFSPIEEKVIYCLKELCVMTAGDYEIQRESSTPMFRSDGPKRASTRGWGTSGPRGGMGTGRGGFGGNQGSYGGNSGGFGGNSGSGYGGNSGGFGGNRGGYGGNQGSYGGNQGGYGGSQGGYSGNRGGFGGNRGGFGNSGGGFGNSGSGFGGSSYDRGSFNRGGRGAGFNRGGYGNGGGFDNGGGSWY